MRQKSLAKPFMNTKNTPNNAVGVSALMGSLETP
jgi:hypothetical protein